MDPEVKRTFYFYPERWKAAALQSSSRELGYLPNTGNWEIRLRRGQDCRLSLTPVSGQVGDEWETRVAPTDFDLLWGQTEGQRLVSLRERHQWKRLPFEVDRYGGALTGLNVAEVAFVDQAAARAFRPPTAFGPEVTYDPRLKNRSLAAGDSIPVLPPEPGRLGWSFGVLPYRPTPQGPELILVSARRGDRWLFPKGQPEPGMTFEKVALAEAREEAGLEGRRVGHPLVLPYTRETGVVNLLLFPLQVTKMAPRWLEENQRIRRSVPLAEAGAYGELATLGAQWVRATFGGETAKTPRW